MCFVLFCLVFCIDLIGTSYLFLFIFRLLVIYYFFLLGFLIERKTTLKQKHHYYYYSYCTTFFFTNFTSFLCSHSLKVLEYILFMRLTYYTQANYTDDCLDDFLLIFIKSLKGKGVILK